MQYGEGNIPVQNPIVVGQLAGLAHLDLLLRIEAAAASFQLEVDGTYNLSEL